MCIMLVCHILFDGHGHTICFHCVLQTDDDINRVMVKYAFNMGFIFNLHIFNLTVKTIESRFERFIVGDA